MVERGADAGTGAGEELVGLLGKLSYWQMLLVGQVSTDVKLSFTQVRHVEEGGSLLDVGECEFLQQGCLEGCILVSGQQ